jgi:NTE family protein
VNVPSKRKLQRSESRQRRHPNTVLVLQGGGALGAYQAGAYEGLAEAGILPDWITGVSIGAINAALIAGNPPERRVERLRAFWDHLSSWSPFVLPEALDSMRPAFNRLSAASGAMFGVPGFFAPNVPPPFLSADGSPNALSFYDTTPLLDTLESLVDFDLINCQEVRLSLGAANVRTANSIYFDNSSTRITADHVRASGSLPPGFPPVAIDGEHYWDGGIVSNTPLWYVLDESPKMDALIVTIDLFHALGELPRNIDEVLERGKDIQYSSKLRFDTKRLKELGDLRESLGRVLAKLPPGLKSNPDVTKLAAACDTGDVTIAHLINRRLEHSAQSKDCEFSRSTVNELWAEGLADVRRAVADVEWLEPRQLGNGIRVYDLTR